MNTSPKRDLEMRKTVVTYMTMKAIENQLKKGQKDGDATKIVTGGEIEKIDDLTPRIESNIGVHKVSLDDRCRILSNGQKMNNDKINAKRREIQKAIIEEQKEQNEASLDNDIEI